MPNLKISLLMDNAITPITLIPNDCIPMYTANPELLLVTIDFVMDTLKNLVPQGQDCNAQLIITDLMIPLDMLHCNSWATRANIELNVISILYPSRRRK